MRTMVIHQGRKAILIGILGLLLILPAGSKVRSEAGTPGQRGGVAIDAGNAADWEAEVADQVRRMEYHFTSQDDSWSAPNRRHGLRARVHPGGIEVVSRTEGEAGFRIAFEVDGFGRPGSIEAVEPGRVIAHEGRAFLDRGRLEEWWVNGDTGLEHGFTLWRAPAGNDGPVVIRIAIDGTLSAFPAGDRAIWFRDPAGIPILHYADLVVTDARQGRVPARLVVRTGAIDIEIDDARAAYPLRVDPVLTAPSWTSESNQPGAFFGISVAPAGDVNGDGYSDMLVGASEFDNGQVDEGRAFVYHGTPSGPLALANWTGEINQAYANYGQSVAAAGDVNGDGYGDIIVGAYFYDGGAIDEGGAFVYHGSATGLSATPAWTGRGGQDAAFYGLAVSGAGDANGDGFDDVVVGASFYDNGEDDEGAAFLYLGSVTGLPATAAWMVESNETQANLGSSVAAAGDVNGDGYADLAVGAYLYDGADVDLGKVWVYHGASGGPGQNAAWTMEGSQSQENYGVSIAGVGDVDGDGYGDLVVGADRFSNGHLEEGVAYLYRGSAGGLSTTPSWTVEGNQEAASFGHTVAAAGDVNGDGHADVLVGAERYDSGQEDEGRGFLYEGSAGGLASVPAWSAEGNQDSALLGGSFAGVGDVNGDGFADVLVGVERLDNGQLDEGRVQLYYGYSAGLATIAAWAPAGSQTETRLGLSVASAGDVNGDGYSDLMVGAPWFDGGQLDEGRVTVHLGSPAGPSVAPSWTAEGNLEAADFGIAVAPAGDVNGDGYGDVIIGSDTFRNGQAEEGRAVVYHGSPSGLGAAPAWAVESNQGSAYFGVAVAGAGDVNGDGFADVIVGANGYRNGQADEGAAFLYQGSASGLGLTAVWTAEANQAYAYFGTSVGPAGDVNGDGFSDVAVGADWFDNGQVDEGRVFVYHGSSLGLSTVANWTAEGDQDGAEFGFAASSAGDVNGDGYSDLVVGSYLYDNVELDEGRAVVYHGSALGLATAPAWSFECNQHYAYCGHAAASAGDVNGDGYSDLVVGAEWYDGGQPDEGKAWVFHGAASGLATVPAWTLESNQAYAELGVAVAAAGDVNGDGFGDLLLGADTYDGTLLDEGRVFLHYGGGGDGVDRRSQQRRADGAAPIAPLGISDSGVSFRVRANGRTPAGRGRIRVEIETKPLGTPFDGTGLVRAADFADSGSPQAAGSFLSVEELIGGLNGRTTYRWRYRTTGDSFLFPRSPWFSPPHNGSREADLRTPGAVDLDGDGVPSGTDCNDANSAVWRIPGEVIGGSIAADRMTISWIAPADLGGTPASVLYDTLRSEAVGSFTSGTVCVESNHGADTVATDGAAPALGSGFYYLIRAENACGAGSLGTRSDGTQRSGVNCP